jgi:hypothetical protein
MRELMQNGPVVALIRECSIEAIDGWIQVDSLAKLYDLKISKGKINKQRGLTRGPSPRMGSPKWYGLLDSC